VPNQYEFFVGATSKGKQTSNSITLTDEEVSGNTVSVSLYYPAFTQPAVPDNTFNVNGVDFTMKGIQGGTFTMGMDKEEGIPIYGEPFYNTYGTYLQKHSVNVSSFLMGETEITRSQWVAVMGMLPLQQDPNESAQSSITTYSGGYANYPVVNVSWYAAITYCNKLSILQGKSIVYKINGMLETDYDWQNLAYGSIPTGNTWKDAGITIDYTANGFRLPTEAEWEYAASGGLHDTGKAYAGSDDICEAGWYAGNNNVSTACADTEAGASTYRNVYGSKPVGQKASNEFGLRDMSGNVWEWCGDLLNQYPSCGRVQDPVQSDVNDNFDFGATRVMRGGSWTDSAGICAMSYRNTQPPTLSSHTAGLRVVSVP
jgi:formylglycine-generating enzyme required for sulfatase activity